MLLFFISTGVYELECPLNKLGKNGTTAARFITSNYSKTPDITT